MTNVSAAGAIWMKSVVADANPLLVAMSVLYPARSRLRFVNVAMPLITLTVSTPPSVSLELGGRERVTLPLKEVSTDPEEFSAATVRPKSAPGVTVEGGGA